MIYRWHAMSGTLLRVHDRVRRYLQRPITVLVISLALLGASAPLVSSVARSGTAWLAYRTAQECEGGWDTNCWTESSADVIRVDRHHNWRGLHTTTLELRHGSGRLNTTVPGLMDATKAGQTVSARAWDGVITHVGDRHSMDQTTSNPRITLPRSIGFAGGMIGAGVLFLYIAIASRRSCGSWLGRSKYQRSLRTPLPLAIGAVAPFPATLVTVYWFHQPVWFPLVVDAATATVATTVVILMRRRPRSRR